MPRVGFHVSISGGISNSVDNAAKFGCSAFQIFSRNPRGWAAKPLGSADVELFKRKVSDIKMDPEAIVVHMPYLPNLSGPPGEFYQKSAQVLAEEMLRCSALEIPFLVIHLGSHMGKGLTQGITQLTQAIENAIVATEKLERRNKVTILLENSAGQKNAVGSKFDEIRAILDRIAIKPSRVGVCLDTCHLFASGHDLRSAGGVNFTLEKFEDVIGLKHLKVIHLNDSKGELGSALDRHEHIGLGSIGLEGLGAFLKHKSTKDLAFIMETPIDETRGDDDNMKVIKGLLK
jgi:deoxyribonuclease-4